MTPREQRDQMIATLAHHRRERRLSQETLGERVGIAGRQIGYYEVTQTEPRITDLIKWADYFGYSIQMVKKST